MWQFRSLTKSGSAGASGGSMAELAQRDATSACQELRLVAVSAAWTVANDLITSTFKVKRSRIEDLYAALYERWEACGQQVIWESA